MKISKEEKQKLRKARMRKQIKQDGHKEIIRKGIYFLIAVIIGVTLSFIYNKFIKSDKDNSIDYEPSVIAENSNIKAGSWKADLFNAHKMNVDFVLPRNIKKFYVDSNYAALQSEVKSSKLIQSGLKNVYDKNGKLDPEISKEFKKDLRSQYQTAMDVMTGRYQLNVDESSVMDEIKNLGVKGKLTAKYLINQRPMQIHKDSHRLIALYSLKSFNDSKGTRGKFSEDPIGWPENIKIKNHQINEEKTYSGYLWNRSHIVADRFGGPADGVNSTTGTRTQNVGDNDGEGGGMLFMENALAKFYEKGDTPFMSFYEKTGLVPLIQVYTEIIPSRDVKSMRNIVNVSNVRIKLIKVADKSINKHVKKNQLIDLGRAPEEFQKAFKSEFNYVYNKKYPKQVKFYDELFEESSEDIGATIIVPNIIKGLEFSYTIDDGINVTNEEDIRK